MLKKWYCQEDLKLKITPIDPILVKSGLAQVTGADMHPVATKRDDGTAAYFLPGTSLKGVFRSHLERIARTLATQHTWRMGRVIDSSSLSISLSDCRR